MPTRDEQDYERRRQRILDGALEVFASKGFEKATIKDVAAAAGITSPALIYHYFKDKEDVFEHLAQQRVPLLTLIGRPEQFMELPPREALTAFASGLARAADSRATISLMKLILGESLRRPAVASMLNAVGPSRGFALLARYLERQMELGALRRMDVGAAVRCFIGPIVIYMLTRVVFLQPDSEALTTDEMVAAAVEVFLRGMETSASGLQDAPDAGARSERREQQRQS
jgi:AcrR family transcriptional regulator